MKLKFGWYFIVLLILTGLFICFRMYQVTYAQGSFTDDYDYTEIQKVLDDALSNEKSFQFRDYVEELIHGEESFSLKGMIDKLFLSFRLEFKESIGSISKLMVIAVIAAVFANFSHTFMNSSVAETGFYVTYLMMFGILAASFSSATAIAASTLDKILEFMKVLVPVYSMSIAFSVGISTSTLTYQGILILITVVDVVLVKIIIPVINLYMMIMLANNISKEDLLSKMGKLLSLIIRWSLKTLLAVVIGIGTIQSLLAPAIDQMKRSVVLKAADSIPALGGLFSGVAETVLGAGMLLKNSIGVAGMVAVLLICLVPLIKIAVLVLVYHIAGAIIQPISDKRIIHCLGALAEANGMLLYTVFVGATLFEIVITVVASATRNIGL